MAPADVAAVLGGLVALVAGADLLVRGAAGAAERFGTPPLVIGLTVVAFGTSAPELAVTVGAAATGDGDVALGNVVGSNLFNLLVVLGATALVGGLVVDRVLLRLEAPLLVVLTAVVWVLARDGSLGRLEGSFLVLGAVALTVVLVLRARRMPGDPDPLAEPAGHRPLPVDAAFVVAGLAALVAGARWLVGGATGIATELGVPDVVIGLTVVAAGTSLPELATSVVAAGRGQRDIAVGNVLGSNLLNLLVVLGAGAVAAPAGLGVDPDVARVDLPLLVGTQLLVIPMLWTGARVGRVEGLVLLGGYGAYVTLVLAPRVLLG